VSSRELRVGKSNQ